jgi:predicted nucleotidyltransferase
VKEVGDLLDNLPAPATAVSALGEVRDQLQAAAGDNLTALVIYGGLARGRHRGHHSDIDLAVVLEDASPARVAEIATALRTAARAARVEPWLLARGELPRLAEVFPTKLLDIREHHLLVSGEDVFASLEIDRGQLRLRVEQELTNLSLRLRRALVGLAGDRASMATQLTAVARPLAIQLAVLLRLAGRDLPEVDRTAAIYADAAAAFDLDAEALGQLAALRQGEGGPSDVADLFGRVQVVATRAAQVAAEMETAR